MDEKRLNLATGIIVDSAYRIHTRVGPGLFESAYCKMLVPSLKRRGLKVEPEKWISFEYEGELIENAYRVDMLVEGAIIVEVKSVPKLAPVFEKQMLTYMRLMKVPLGLLLNFGASLIRDGIKRYKL